MILSKTTGYGVMALAYLAGKEVSMVCGLQEIAETECIPPIYLRKILGELRRHRILRSIKGIHGGYSLARLADTITVWEVNQILAPDPYLDDCVLGSDLCKSADSCVVHDRWQRIRRDYIELLKTTTMAHIARSRQKRRPYSQIHENEEEW